MILGLCGHISSRESLLWREAHMLSYHNPVYTMLALVKLLGHGDLMRNCKVAFFTGLT